MEKPNNPHAFPMISAQGEYSQEGMTLRDYFANSAMQALLNSDMHMSKLVSSDMDVNDKILANTAYRVADAMLKQRELNNQ
jgi:hypothetical protein